MPTLSLITAVHPSGGQYVEATVDSVLRQELPPGWELEWLVQEDGAEPRQAELFAGVADYQATGGQHGPGVTRNVALTRASGELVRNLDHDDLLLPGALAGLITRFDDPEIGWAATQADDLLPDGTRRPYASALPFGVLTPGVVNDWALKHHACWPIHCAGLTVRTQLLRSVGGWGAAPSDDDLVMFAAVSELSAGYNDPAVTWLYRHHDTQLSRQENWWRNDSASKAAVMQRIHALRNGVQSKPLATTEFEAFPNRRGQKLASGWWADGTQHRS
ncbi:glycosyltransferase [Kribbella sp. DT2]|uniref:glycosyltransferase n=1 Tax=Kribbella sp. DT2 TaxID=3393427 RepID=UPI003CF54269